MEGTEILKRPQNGQPNLESTFKTWDFKINIFSIMNLLTRSV